MSLIASDHTFLSFFFAVHIANLLTARCSEEKCRSFRQQLNRQIKQNILKHLHSRRWRNWRIGWSPWSRFSLPSRWFMLIRSMGCFCWWKKTLRSNRLMIKTKLRRCPSTIHIDVRSYVSFDSNVNWSPSMRMIGLARRLIQRMVSSFPRWVTWFSQILSQRRPQILMEALHQRVNSE